MLSFAALDFDVKAQIKCDDDLLDALATGVNMLGDELKGAVITVEEKQVLIKEIHHRVKNNLQIVTSILNLQIFYTEDPIAKLKLQECVVRIRSMALVHEKLYQSINIAKVELGDYLRSLCVFLNDIYNPGKVKFSFISEADEIYLSPDEVIPLGLVVSELVSNSFKYAFSDKEENCFLTVSINKSGNNCLLKVYDSGNGFEVENKMNDSETLGMQLIQSLVNQIDGNLTIDNKDGLTFCVEFESVNDN